MQAAFDWLRSCFSSDFNFFVWSQIMVRLWLVFLSKTISFIVAHNRVYARLLVFRDTSLHSFMSQISKQPRQAHGHGIGERFAVYYPACQSSITFSATLIQAVFFHFVFVPFFTYGSWQLLQTSNPDLVMYLFEWNSISPRNRTCVSVHTPPIGLIFSCPRVFVFSSYTTPAD